MCWEMEIRTFPTAVSAVCSSQSSAHSNPHAGEGANTLAPCWALGNHSANILACLLNSSSPPPPSAPSTSQYHSVGTEPNLGCANTPHTSAQETTRALALTTEFALPTMVSVMF